MCEDLFPFFSVQFEVGQVSNETSIVLTKSSIGKVGNTLNFN